METQLQKDFKQPSGTMKYSNFCAFTKWQTVPFYDASLAEIQVAAIDNKTVEKHQAHIQLKSRWILTSDSSLNTAQRGGTSTGHWKTDKQTDRDRFGTTAGSKASHRQGCRFGLIQEQGKISGRFLQVKDQMDDPPTTFLSLLVFGLGSSKSTPLALAGSSAGRKPRLSIKL